MQVSKQEGALQYPKVWSESLLQPRLLPKAPATLYCRCFTKHPCVVTPTFHAVEWRIRVSLVSWKETKAQSVCPLPAEQNQPTESSAWCGFDFMEEEVKGKRVTAQITLKDRTRA